MVTLKYKDTTYSYIIMDGKVTNFVLDGPQNSEEQKAALWEMESDFLKSFGVIPDEEIESD